jgi:hypothetical protein
MRIGTSRAENEVEDAEARARREADAETMDDADDFGEGVVAADVGLERPHVLAAAVAEPGDEDAVLEKILAMVVGH